MPRYCWNFIQAGGIRCCVAFGKVVLHQAEVVNAIALEVAVADIQRVDVPQLTSRRGRL